MVEPPAAESGGEVVTTHGGNVSIPMGVEEGDARSGETGSWEVRGSDPTSKLAVSLSHALLVFPREDPASLMIV